MISKETDPRRVKACARSVRWYAVNRTKRLAQRALNQARERQAAGLASIATRRRLPPFESFCTAQLGRINRLLSTSAVLVPEDEDGQEPTLALREYVVETRGMNHAMGSRKGSCG